MRRTLFCVLAVAAVALAENGGRLLIVSTDALYNSILPLATWKQAAGISTRVVKLSQIGSDTASIKNYIRNAWSTWPVKPENVILVGSPNSLPARAYRMMHNEYYYSDNIYGNVIGDFRMDIPVGRFPAKSAAQLDVMVAKTLGYERTPVVSDTLWTRRMTTVCRDAGDDDAYTYWSDIRSAISRAAAAGFRGFDSLASTRGHSQYDITNSINAGTGMVMYRGSATGNWYAPFAVDPASTNGSGRLPVILSFTCATLTLAPGETMVGDAWLKAGTVAIPKGGVAFFGNCYSASNVAQQRSAVCRGFFTGLFGEQKYRLGLSCMRAKEQLYQEYRYDTTDYRGFNLFGDPTLDIWTDAPALLDVAHPADLRPGQQVLHVTVTTDGVPVESATVCASMASDTTLYAYGLTNFNGELNLDISPADTGRVRLVVTGHNLYPYDTLIPVTLVSVEEPNVPAAAGPARLTVAPAVFRDATRISWNPAVRRATVRIVDASGRTVAGLGAQGSSVTWHATGLQAGVYTCVLVDRYGLTADRVKTTKLP